MNNYSLKAILLSVALLPTMLLTSQTTLRQNKEQQHIYRVTLTDKKGSSGSLKHPERYLSPRALERRQRQGLPVDSTDLPISERYQKAIRQEGINIVGASKWLNTLLITGCDEKKLAAVRGKKFVSNIEQVWQAPDSLYKQRKREPLTSRSQMSESNQNDIYGKSATQIDLIGGRQLHTEGYRGEGMMIAVIDGGYMNADRIPLLDNVKILGQKNFAATHRDDIFAEVDHGTMVLSCLAANQPGLFIGTAPAAEYWLLRSEVDDYEQVVEEDYWVMAVEFADSIGADIISSSLGYQAFETEIGNHRYCDQNGMTATNSRAASMVASKGMILVNSAGNFGRGSWKKINCPADATNILAVGAVRADGINTDFSSIGPTADGRVKPDVMSMGGQSTVIDGTGDVTTANGTSFATPILAGMVACLWQAHPSMTAFEIMNLVRSSGSRFDCPDNIFGNGIPDFGRAHSLGR